MHKKRRFDRRFGYIVDLNEDCSNVKFERGRIKDISWLKFRIVSLKEPQRMARIGEELELVFQSEESPRSGPHRVISVPDQKPCQYLSITTSACPLSN